jgi:hypothetical protein
MGVAGAPGHVGQAAHHLHHLIQRGAVVVGAGQKAFVADVNQARVELFQGLVIEAQLLHGLGLEVLAHHVGGGDQPEHRFLALWRVQVQRQAFLVAVEQRKKAGARAEQAARVVALGRLDLDHLRAQVAQHHAAGRAHDHVGEFDDAQTVVGQWRGSRNGHATHGTATEPAATTNKKVTGKCAKQFLMWGEDTNTVNCTQPARPTARFVWATLSTLLGKSRPVDRGPNDRPLGVNLQNGGWRAIGPAATHSGNRPSGARFRRFHPRGFASLFLPAGATP